MDKHNYIIAHKSDGRLREGALLENIENREDFKNTEQAVI